ncbi:MULTISPECIES: HAD family hydrolase [unclassified Mesorhizobium]|uniref:HAD family hydrolase n=1 Tax=unclassified Mesorhizobium TaxID=325217 RepID=UPI000FCC4906|nr:MULTISPECIES: HAD family hydrolase [unclassified Mesorhizobium]RUV64046.1 HAD family hydrolase [Mesorhizobium sp. M5C.F.Ca.IN.020.29.1.1]RWA98017.1 MAG: HAD family hydrolase [Mesorhizobium sp.]RWC25212.1 MAG: HAD family hydrolase [Mesorhizobium sp.]RWD77078.1 MAG: HAD family hydrolase [Mesorhizobium sp.]RWE52535.1 MAG: HAD family hydrolase [Mesorhizobium sp.]
MRGAVVKTNVLTDADNTLWDTDRVFASAQLELLGLVERALKREAIPEDRLAYVRSLDQMLAERHHAGLRYPPRHLAKAIALALTGVRAQEAARLAWTSATERQVIGDLEAETAERTFLAAVQRLPDLRDGVAEGIHALHTAGCLITVVTEGSREKAARTARSHGIGHYIDRIIEAPKHLGLYKRVQLLPGVSSPGYMIGDQLERDIRPAKEAGLITIYYPGGFKPRWEADPQLVQPDFTVSSFAEVPAIVLKASHPPQKSNKFHSQPQ